MVEFAVAVPLYVILLAALFDFSRVSLQQNMVKDQVSIAGRYAAAQDGKCLEQVEIMLLKQEDDSAITDGLEWSNLQTSYHVATGGVVSMRVSIDSSTKCFFCSLLMGIGSDDDSVDTDADPHLGTDIEDEVFDADDGPVFSFRTVKFFSVEHDRCIQEAITVSSI